MPCEGGTPPLGAQEFAPYLQQLSSEWEVVEQKKIKRKFRFAGFRETINFVDKVAELAEAEGHHPDMDIRYNRVVINLTTRFIGGLSENDFILARKIELMYN